MALFIEEVSYSGHVEPILNGAYFSPPSPLFTAIHINAPPMECQWASPESRLFFFPLVFALSAKLHPTHFPRTPTKLLDDGSKTTVGFYFAAHKRRGTQSRSMIAAPRNTVANFPGKRTRHGDSVQCNDKKLDNFSLPLEKAQPRIVVAC